MNVCRSVASALVRSLLACGALMPPPASTVNPMSMLSWVFVSVSTVSGVVASAGGVGWSDAGSLIVLPRVRLLLSQRSIDYRARIPRTSRPRFADADCLTDAKKASDTFPRCT